MDKTNLMVEFSIIGDNFNPDEITKSLGIEPTECYIKGYDKNRYFKMKESSWSLSTGYIQTVYISDLFDELINKLTSKKDILLELKNKYNLMFKFFVVINIENGEKPAIYLDKEVVSFANYLSAEFDFDLYIYS